MSTAHDETADTTDADETRRALEREAEHAEERLLATIEIVDRRAHQVERTATRLPHRIAVSMLTACAVVGVGGAALAVHHRRRRVRASAFASRFSANAFRAVASLLVAVLARHVTAAILAEDLRD